MHKLQPIMLKWQQKKSLACAQCCCVTVYAVYRLFCLFKSCSKIVWLCCVHFVFSPYRHSLLSKAFKQYRQRTVLIKWYSQSLCALAFCICSFYAVLHPSYQLAVQTSVSALNSPLYVHTEEGLYSFTPPPPLSSSPPLSFFFASLASEHPLTRSLTSQLTRWASLKCFIQQDWFWNWKLRWWGGGGWAPGVSLRHQVCMQRGRAKEEKRSSHQMNEIPSSGHVIRGA